MGSLLLPLVLTLQEALTNRHAPASLYYPTVAVVAVNHLFGMLLIPSRFPAYDIPSARGLAVGSLYGLAFLGWSLTFRIGTCAWYEPWGKCCAIVALYAWLFACSDALQNSYCWVRGKYKTQLGKTWDLPFVASSYRQVFFHNIYRQPTPRALRSSLMTAPHGALPTLFVALFGSVLLLQLPYLHRGPARLAHLTTLHPDLARWACYQSLMVVVCNQFAVFLVSLVIHRRIDLAAVTFYNVMVPLIPLMNILAFARRFPDVALGGIVSTLLAR